MLGNWARRPRTRARDIDREYAAGMLRDATVEGQLSSDEFDDRLRQVLSAKCLGELVPLVADLQTAEDLRHPSDATSVLPPVQVAVAPSLTGLDWRPRPAEDPEMAPATSQLSGRLAVLSFVMLVVGLVVAVWTFTT